MLCHNSQNKYNEDAVMIKRILISVCLLLWAGTASAGLLSLSGEEELVDRYIVVLEGEAVEDTTVGQLASELSDIYGGVSDLLYQHALKGFAVEMTSSQAVTMAADPRVRYIEPDQPMELFATVQEDAIWGLDRIDQSDLPLDGRYVYDRAADNINIYVIDTGLNASHNEFTGRVGQGFNAVPDTGLLLGTDDCNGHGTHVAGTAMGTDFGVAKQAIIYPVRVFSCGPTTLNSFVLAGIDWVTENHRSPAVANMSLGGGASQATDEAVQNSIDAGVFYAVAAGNEDVDACNSSPARVAEAMTVGSTTREDIRSSFSNKGECVDIFAPGSNIVSADYLFNSGTQTLSGTSMASPHVAGAAALVLDADPQASVTEVFDALINKASKDRLSNVGSGSPNLLLFARDPQ